MSLTRSFLTGRHKWSCLRIFVVLLPLLLALDVFSSNPDTTWTATFEVNMSKAVRENHFSPDSGTVFLVMDNFTPLQMVPGPGYVYSVTVSKVFLQTVNYEYRFSINDSVPENITRHLAPHPGPFVVAAWWNNVPMNITTFEVNMALAPESGKFNPLTDSVCMIGTLNPPADYIRMERVGTSLTYRHIDSLQVPGTLQQFKYRINADSAGLELLNKPARMIRIPDSVTSTSCDYNNYNPARLPVTFRCNMEYYVRTYHFDTGSDFLDIAGNFNGHGANDVLFDPDGDTIYSVEMYLDTAWVHQGPLAFKFRINGMDSTAELAGKPDRNYAMHDTISLNPNIFQCFFNDLNPTLPTPPWAEEVAIQGSLVYKKVLSGSYNYINVNGIPEGISTYRWLRSGNAQGLDAVAIDSAWSLTYVVDTLDIGNWLVFEITPKAASGDSLTGKPVRVVASGSISAWDVGTGELNNLISRAYPNPATDFIIVETKQQVTTIELINYLDQIVVFQRGEGSTSFRIPLNFLPGGMYILKAVTRNGQSGTIKLLKQ